MWQPGWQLPPPPPTAWPWPDLAAPPDKTPVLEPKQKQPTMYCRPRPIYDPKAPAAPMVPEGDASRRRRSTRGRPLLPRPFAPHGDFAPGATTISPRSAASPATAGGDAFGTVAGVKRKAEDGDEPGGTTRIRTQHRKRDDGSRPPMQSPQMGEMGPTGPAHTLVNIGQFLETRPSRPQPEVKCMSSSWNFIPTVGE
eukprot:scaffold434_cov186-Pinguiococcus_pyrenoidosus.AAC.65